jgi:6-phosphogluconolactonase
VLRSFRTVGANYLARSNKETTRQAKTFAVEHEPELRPDSDSEKEQKNAQPPPSENNTTKEVEVAAAAAAVPAPAAKPKKAKKEKKEPWPLSRNTNPVSTTGRTHFNIIKRSQWPTGVPKVMGGHVMPSGLVAPVTQSKGCISDVYSAAETQHVHPFHYDGDDLPEERAKLAIYSDKQALGVKLCQDVAFAARDAIEKTGKFTVALSGGSLLGLLSGLSSNSDLKTSVDWGKVFVFWVDERLVALDSEDSNAGAAKKAFLDELQIPTDQHHVIDASLSVDQAARAYEGKMLSLPHTVLPRSEKNPAVPSLDMVLLGMGPDGHVASLFPNRKELAENPESWVLPVRQSPKPPSERITMTMDLIVAAKQVCLVAAGKGKSEIVQRCLEVQTLPGALPAQLVRPKEGVLTWYLDVEAASDIRPSTWEDKKAYPRNKY